MTLFITKLTGAASLLEMKVPWIQAHEFPWTFVWHIPSLMLQCDFKWFLSITLLGFSNYIKSTTRWLTGIIHNNTSAPRTALRPPSLYLHLKRHCM